MHVGGRNPWRTVIRWHLQHLGARAVGGAGLVISEATAVVPEGRISLRDVGIWNEQQASAWARIAGFVRAQGAMPGVQLAHAGRKASSQVPSEGQGAVDLAGGGWETVAPSSLAFGSRPVPKELSEADVAGVVRRPGLRRGCRAGGRRKLRGGRDPRTCCISSSRR